MYAAAKLVSLSARDIELVADAIAKVGAVFSAPRRSNVACGYYLVVVDDYRAVSSSEAGASFRNGIGDIEVVVDFVSALHYYQSFHKGII